MVSPSPHCPVLHQGSSAGSPRPPRPHSPGSMPAQLAQRAVRAWGLAGTCLHSKMPAWVYIYKRCSPAPLISGRAAGRAAAGLSEAAAAQLGACSTAWAEPSPAPQAGPLLHQPAPLTWAELGPKPRIPPVPMPTTARNKATARMIQNVLGGPGNCAASLLSWGPRQNEGRTGVKRNASLP